MMNQLKKSMNFCQEKISAYCGISMYRAFGWITRGLCINFVLKIKSADEVGNTRFFY